MSKFYGYKLWYCDKNGCQLINDNCSRDKYEELYFRYHGRNSVYVYLFGINILVICYSNYGSVWVNKAS